MKKYALSALMAVALVCNANADNSNGNSNNGNGNTHSVPDSGSTAALMGLSVAILLLAQRKLAIIK